MRSSQLQPLPPSSTPDGALVSRVAEFCEHALHVTGTPGLNVAVARHDELIWEAGFGLADIADTKPMTPSTITRGASLSKMYTTIAVLQLVEQERVGLYDPVNSHIDNLALTNPLGERDITVYDLLTFNSGLATDTADSTTEDPLPLSAYLSQELAEPALREYGRTIPRWAAKVGQGRFYSNLGFSVLGHLVERVNPDRLSLSEYVHRHIFDPLGMDSTSLPQVEAEPYVSGDALDRISTGYACFGDIAVPAPRFRSNAFPSCGLLTTPGDHIRLLLALQNGGEYHGRRVLEEATVRRMMTPQAAVTERDMPGGWWFGLGVAVGELGTQRYHFGYPGAYPWGWRNESRAYPHLDLTIVVFSNGWQMLQWHDPTNMVLPSIVADFAASHVLRDGNQPYQPGRRSLPALVSHVAGMIMGERSRGFLGVDGFPSEADVEGLVGGAGHFTGRALQLAEWDPEAFRAGMEQVLDLDMSPKALSAAIEAGSFGAAREELAVAGTALGGRGALPVPLSFWSHADNQFR